MAAQKEFDAVMEAARAAVRAKTVHQRYSCVQALDKAVKAYDRATVRVDQMRDRAIVVPKTCWKHGGTETCATCDCDD